MIQRTPIADDLVDYETYRTLVPDGQKADLIEGVIYMAAADSRLSNSVNGFLYRLIADFIDARNIDGFFFLSRFSCRLSDFNAPEPDVGYVRPERSHLIDERHMVGGPDIAVEVVSRESRHRDYGDKRNLYETAGVAEYWIIDPLQSRVEFLGLKDGRYEILPLNDNHIFRTTVIPGFWLDVNWLLTKPLPRAYQCLQHILAAPKQTPAKRRKRR